MAGPEQAGGISVRIDPAEWFRFKSEVDAVDKNLTKALRGRIRNAGNVAVENVRQKLRMPTPGGSEVDRREALIAATKVTVGFSARTAGAKIVTSSSGLDEKHKGLLKVYNKATFRHPVFGNKSDWVQQTGRPYFGAAIMAVLNKAIFQEIEAAFDDAAASIGANTK